MRAYSDRSAGHQIANALPTAVARGSGSDGSQYFVERQEDGRHPSFRKFLQDSAVLAVGLV
jgi:hypothetical protein